MILPYLLAATELASHSTGNMVTDIATEFGVDGPKLLSQFIVFGVIAFSLKKFAFGPIEEILEKRKNTIAESLANAEKIKEELAAAEATRREVLSRANQRASEILEEAQKTATLQIQKASQEAIATAEEIARKSREATALERERELEKLKREVSSLVADLTVKVIGRTLTDEDRARLNSEVVAQIGRN